MNTGDTKKLTIGQAIKKARKSKKFTQAKLEAKTGLSRASISHWENDVVTLNTINAISIADALGVTLDELVGRTVK